jgi:hypothetical protein
MSSNKRYRIKYLRSPEITHVGVRRMLYVEVRNGVVRECKCLNPLKGNDPFGWVGSLWPLFVESQRA